MSAFFWFLLLLAPVLAVGYVLWAYRNKAAEREAASRERLTALVGIVQGKHAAGSGVRSGEATLPGASRPSTDQQRSAVRPPFLTQPETLLYYVLKVWLPDYEVFPRVSLTSVMAQNANAAAMPGERPPVGQEVDFVICDKRMQVVAAVQLDGQPDRQETQFVGDRLRAAGIRVIRLSPAALPRREQVRSLIFGQAA